MRRRSCHKFDIAYFVAIEKLSFRKYPQICELEARHGVNIGSSYTNDMNARTFVHYIAEAQRQNLISIIEKKRFYSLLIDGSTDSGNIDNELILLVWFDINGPDEEVHTLINYFKICCPTKTSGEGLYEMLEQALGSLGVEEINEGSCSKLIDMGTDGASANIAGRGLKGLMERKLPWLYWMWCIAHRLELAVKDALKGTAFDDIEEMLLRLYYIYENSPKKCRELTKVVSSLRECFELEEGGVRPLRSSGSRWISHKWNAMKLVLAKYGAYTSHLISLSEDHSLKSSNRSKIKGYSSKWTNGKYILGCALFVDLLLLKSCVVVQ